MDCDVDYNILKLLVWLIEDLAAAAVRLVLSHRFIQEDCLEAGVSQDHC